MGGSVHVNLIKFLSPILIFHLTQHFLAINFKLICCNTPLPSSAICLFIFCVIVLYLIIIAITYGPLYLTFEGHKLDKYVKINNRLESGSQHLLRAISPNNFFAATLKDPNYYNTQTELLLNLSILIQNRFTKLFNKMIYIHTMKFFFFFAEQLHLNSF